MADASLATLDPAQEACSDHESTLQGCPEAQIHCPDPPHSLITVDAVPSDGLTCSGHAGSDMDDQLSSADDACRILTTSGHGQQMHPELEVSDSLGESSEQGFESARDPEVSNSRLNNGLEPLIAEHHLDKGRSIPACSLPGDRITNVPRKQTFFLVKVPRTGDSSLRSKIKLAEFQLEEAIKTRDFIQAAYQLKRANKAELVEKLKIARDDERTCKEAFQQHKMKMEPLQNALAKLKSSSSEEKLNDKIAHINYRISHESISLKEEKQLLWEIRQLEASRSQVCANEAIEAELIESFGSREEIEEQYAILKEEMKCLKDALFQARCECEPVEKLLHDINLVINDLMEQLESAQQAQQEAFYACKQLKRLLGEQNSDFYKNREDIKKAKELAAVKSVDDLVDFCHDQVETILSQWCNNADFRERYKKSNEQSTLRRLQTLDGRSFGRDEVPILLTNEQDIVVDALVNTEETPFQDPLQAKSMQDKDLKTSSAEVRASVVERFVDVPMEQEMAKVGMGPVRKGILDRRLEGTTKSGKKTVENVKAATTIENFEDFMKKESKDAELQEKQRQEEMVLKEKRRQEEMAKAKEAAERKKRRAERAQAKALLRVQKETERREKEREKKLRKRANTETSKPIEGTSELTKDVEAVSEPSKDSSIISERGHSSVFQKKRAVLRPLVSIPFHKKGYWPPRVWAWVILSILFGLLVIFSKKLLLST